MSKSNELGKTQIVTRDGIVTATVLDRVSVDRMYLHLVRGSLAALYGRVVDETPLVSREIKDLILFPFSELT